MYPVNAIWLRKLNQCGIENKETALRCGEHTLEYIYTDI